MLMLTLDDAIKVTQRLIEDAMNDEDIIRQELEQKCWVPSDSEPAKQLYDLIFDINPAEICAQIEAGNLKNWCETIQVVMNLALVRLPLAQTKRKMGKWIPIVKGEHGYSAGDFRCSICEQPNHCYHLTNYCPNCGADMRGETDG